MNIERLQKLRKNMGLTQKETAKKLNLGYQGYNHYETGKREPDNDTLRKIAEFFNVTTDYLLGQTDCEKPFEKSTTQIIKDLKNAGLNEERYNAMTEEQRQDFLQLVKIMTKKSN